MISALFLILAAFFNACMDAFENENFYESIFKGLNPKFWYKRESWKFARKVGGYRMDAWHISKSAMIWSLVLAIVNYRVVINTYIDFAALGLLWNVVFVFFYHKIFRIK